MPVSRPAILVMFSFITVISGSTIASETTGDLRGPYLGQTPPGTTAEMFAPGLVSVVGRYEYGLAFSPDGERILFAAEDLGRNLEDIELNELGRAKKIVIDKDNTTIIEGGGKRGDIDKRVAQIRAQIEQTDSEYDKEKFLNVVN